MSETKEDDFHDYNMFTLSIVAIGEIAQTTAVDAYNQRI